MRIFTLLKSVVLHLDETYPHLHFYAVADKVSNARNLHCGYKAQDDLKADGCNKKHLLDDVYNISMVQYQDRYFNLVSNVLGLSRVSKNPQQRMDRKSFIDLSKANRNTAKQNYISITQRH